MKLRLQSSSPLLVLAGVLLLSSTPRADPQGQMLRALSAKYKPSLVTLSLIVKLSAGGYEDQSELEASGFLLDSSGLVVTTNSAIDPAAAYGGGSEGSASMSSRVVGVKILTTDGQEIPAKVVLRDKDKNLAFVRPIKAPAKKLSGVNFQTSASAQIADPVYLLGRLGKTGGRVVEAKTSRIVSVLDKPRRMYVLDAYAYLYVGDLAFNEKGQPLGLLTQRLPIGKARLSERSLPIIIPARDVWEVARQAPQAKDVKDAKAAQVKPEKAGSKPAKPAAPGNPF